MTSEGTGTEPERSAPEPPHTLLFSERFSRFAARLAFELLVVFAGVSLAFFAENQRERRERNAQMREVYAALAQEIEDHVTVGQRVLDEYVSKQRQWDEAFARGERPIPWYIPWARVGPPQAAWQATLASGGINLIDRPLFYELAKYYRLVEIYIVPVDALDPFVDNEIVPFQERGRAAFYLPGTHRLRPKYQLYLDRRRTILAGAQGAMNRGRVLLAQLHTLANGPTAVVHP